MTCAIAATSISASSKCLSYKDPSPLVVARCRITAASPATLPSLAPTKNCLYRSWTNGWFLTVWIRKRRTIIPFWSMSNPGLSLSNEKEEISLMRRATRCGMTSPRWSSVMDRGVPRGRAGHQPKERWIKTCSGGRGRAKLLEPQSIKSKR